MKITKKQAEKFAIKIVQDTSIDDDSFEETFQHMRDDLFYYASRSDVVELDDIAEFMAMWFTDYMKNILEVNNMGVYSSIDVYPKHYDDIDTSDCDNCTFECWEAGYCIKEND